MSETAKFTWIPFYEELAKKLLEFKDKRNELRDVVNKVREKYRSYIDNKMGDIKDDIDPFSFFGMLNRSTDQRRNEIAETFKAALDIKSELPSDYFGIPIIPTITSVYASKKDDIQIIWDFYVKFISGTFDKDLFERVEKIDGVGLTKSTAPLFWCKPKEYIALDANNRLLLKDSHQIDIVGGDFVSGDLYLQTLNQVNEFVQDSKYSSFADFSEKAWLYVQQKQHCWVISADPKQYDHWKSFIDHQGIIDWSRRINCSEGDVVYIHEKGTHLRYKTTVIQSEVPLKERIDDIKYWFNQPNSAKESHGKKAMRLQLETIMNENTLSPEDLQKYSEKKLNYRGPFEVESPLKEYIEKEFENKGEPFEDSMNANDNLTNKFKTLLLANHNIILHGAPGTGKTYLAKKIAEEMGAEVEMVQFHQSYDYTDFVEGLRPAEGKDGKADGFERQDGVFKKFCKKALDVSKTGIVDNYDECFQQIVAKLEIENVLEIPLISGKGSFYISLNSDSDGFVTMLKDEKSGVFTRDSTRFFNYDQCYNVYRGLPGTPKKGFDNYRKAIVEYMKKNLGLKDYQVGKNVDISQLKKFVFIIDEINRGEISKIFGELFFSIDPGYRGSDGKIRTQYANMQETPNEFDQVLNITDKNDFGHFFVPENVYIIGTMNDIDRSVESMDFAMRRRFAFVEIKADDRIEMLDNLGDKKQEAINRMQALNKVIWDDGEKKGIEGLSSAYHIGPAYFLKLDNYNGDFDKLWKYHIEGVLREYLRGMPDAETLLENLHKAYNQEP